MNKIFKVVWSKTKECYVVVSEVAKNNGGKKKVLASVLAGLAMVGVAAQMGTPVQAGAEYKNSAVNIQPDNIPASQKNSVGKNSTVVGYANTTNNEEGTVAYGGYNTATGNSSTALGSSNTATGGSATAIGSNTVASGAASVALGNLSQATNKGAIAIGTRTNYETTNTTTGAGYGLTAGEYSTTVGGWSRATGQHSSAFGYNNKVTGDHSTAVGTGNTIDGTQVAGAVAVGNQNKASGDRAIAIGETNTSKVEDTITMGTSNTASTGGGIAIGKNNLADSTNKGTQTGGGRGNENSQIAIGRDNEATHIDTVAVGREVKSTGTGAVGLGSRINATGDYAVAIGNSSAGGTVEAADYSVAVGFKAKATGSRSIAQGGAATAAAERSIAMGLKSNVTAQKANSTYSYSGTGGAIVGGVNTSTKTIHSTAGTDGANDIYGSGDEIAIGSSASVSDESNAAVVIGKGAKTEGNAHYSVVVGKDSYANASDGVVVGQGSYVKARESIAIGQTANVSGTGNVRSQAIGFGATVSGTTAYDALAIGSGAQVTDVTSGVALGSGSEVSRKTSDTKSIGLNTKYVDGTKVRNRSYEATVTAAGDKWDDGAQLGAVSVGNDNQKRQIINVAAGNQDTDAVNVAQLKNVGVRVGADTNTATIGTNKVAADFLAYNGQLNIKGDNNRVTTVSENDANGKDANVNVKFDYNGLVKAKAGSSVTVNQKTEGGKTVFEIDAAAGGATSTESVVKKAAATNDTNIADISVADNKNTGDVGAKYEVSVSRNAVKDAAREAVTVNNGGTTKADGSYTADSNNPISVTPTKDDTNHNTSYAVTFDGNKAAKQIPLTYKANGNGAKTVTLEKGLDFTNGTNTTAEIGNDGVVKYNLNKDVDLSNTGSLKVGGTTVNNGGITIKAPTTPGTTTTDVKLTNTGLDNGGNTITNVAEGQNNTDAVNVKQLKANRTEVKAGDNVVVTSAADATDNHTIYTVNAVTPAVYTTPDGEKLTKDKDGKFHKVGETAEYTGDIITSFENPKAAAGQTTKDGGMIVNNVGSAIKNQTGATYLDKLKAAADNNSNVKNAVVNVSDLKNTSDALIDKGLRFDANEGGEQTNKLGSKVTVQGTGALSTGKAYADEYNTANIRTNIEQGTDGNTTINVGLAKALKGINSISNGSSSITISDVPAGATTPAVTISGGNLSMGNGTANNKIVNLAPGTDGTDAVNLNQLKGMRTVVTSTDNSVTVTSNENKATGQVTYDLKVATTGTVSKSTWDLKSGVASATEGTHSGDTTQTIADTKSVTMQAGKNLTVKQTNDGNGNTSVAYSLDKDLTNLDKVVVNGKDGIAGKDGVTIVGPQGATGAPGIPGTNGIDGKVGISGKDGKDAVSIAGKDGVGTIGLTGPQGPAGTNGKSVDISTENGKQTLVKPEANNGNQSQRIVYVPKDANGNPLKDADGNDIKREVATMDDGLRFTGNNTSKENKQPMNSLVKVQGEGVTENAAGKLEANGQEFKSAAGNIAVEADGQNTLTVKMNKDLNLTKDGSVTMGDTVVNNDGITIKAPTTPGTTTTDVKLTNQGLDNGGNKITNVAAGTANTDAVNVKQLKDNVTTVTSSDSSIKVVDKNDPTSATYDATKGHQYDITVNNQGVVNNAQTPVVYTKEDGTKVYKQPNGTFTTNIDGTGTVVPANQVIASMNSAGNSSTDPTKLQNVGSSIADKTGTTFLDKINTAAADPNAKYGAVNVTDLKSTSDALIDKGLVFDANNGDPKTNKLGSKVTIAGTGALGTGENFADKYNTDNIRTNIKQDAAGNTTVEIGLNKNLKGLESVSVPGKDGVDGQDGVSITGKDGANGLDGKVSIGKDGKDAVSISGKDGIGHIGLTGPAGKDGKNATADITVKEGQPGLNGTDGITRIVYKDKDGNDHEVATHDDGVKYAGDDAQGTDKTKVISKKLNQTIDIVGGADKTKLTDNNIGVNNDGGKLKVQLANELAGINKISNGGSSITFNSNPGGATNTPAVQISGGDLNMGGNKITNLKKGTDVSDAATVGQLTKVKSSNNSVGITESTDANGAKVYDLSVTGVPGADPRVDKLGEEIGRVGAQGAALAALKPIQYDPLEPTQIMAGYGNYRGNSAVALGVAHYKNESTLIHGGVSWAGGSSHMMANAGVTWKVGNRDSEAAVADRYRKGPISSTYAMQQEMAAMKAQNAGLKGEVSDLKAENEQMKAQIAAMMAKLGL